MYVCPTFKKSIACNAAYSNLETRQDITRKDKTRQDKTVEHIRSAPND